MPNFKVWGEWQEYDEATENDCPTAESAAMKVAKSADDAFPDWNDGATCKLYVRPSSAEDGDDEWCPEDDPETLRFTVTLRVSYDYTIKSAR
jgi:hypothetical protein